METAASEPPVYRITIPGLLRAKGRPRFGNGRTFTDAKTVQAEKHIQRHAMEQIGKPCLTGPLHVSLMSTSPLRLHGAGRKQQTHWQAVSCRLAGQTSTTR